MVHISMQALVVGLLKALPMLVNVVALSLFYLMLFGIAGVQLFAGVLRNRCAAPNFESSSLGLDGLGRSVLLVSTCCTCVGCRGSAVP